jgi:hypothetical protein
MITDKHWRETLFAYIWIFNVGRGLSVFIRTALNQGIMYDFGCSEEFSPTKFAKEHILPNLDGYGKSKIAQTIISHPHLDHISEIEQLFSSNSTFYAYLHTCPHDKGGPDVEDERINWNRINNPGDAEEKVNIYKKLYNTRNLPLQTIQYNSSRSIPNLEYGIYYIRPPKVAELYPKDDQKYSNGTSLVLFFRQGLHTLLIPGDMPAEAMEHLLQEKPGCEKRYTIFDQSCSRAHPEWHLKTIDQPSLKSCLQTHGLSVLLAPHHGLESGYSEALYSCIKGGKPGLVIISEKRHLSDTDGKVETLYQSQEGANGLSINLERTIEDRYSLSTRDGHHILLVFPGTGGSPRVYAEKDPERLLEKR